MMRELERYVTLNIVNMRWIDHLAAMEDLEEGIGLRGYSGVDPLILYQKESYEYWLNLLATVREDILRYMFRVEFQEAPRQVAVATPHGEPVEFEDTDGMVAPDGRRAGTSGRPGRKPRDTAPIGPPAPPTAARRWAATTPARAGAG